MISPQTSVNFVLHKVEHRPSLNQLFDESHNVKFVATYTPSSHCPLILNDPKLGILSVPMYSSTVYCSLSSERSDAQVGVSDTWSFSSDEIQQTMMATLH